MRSVLSVLCLGALATGVQADDAADCHQETGHAAIAACSRVIEANPDGGAKLAWVYYNRGRNYARSPIAEYGLAIEDFSRAIRLAPNDADAHYARGLCHYFQGEITGAIDDTSKAIALRPGDANFYFIRGKMYESSGLLARAVADYRQAMALDPYNEDIKAALAKFGQ